MRSTFTLRQTLIGVAIAGILFAGAAYWWREYYDWIKYDPLTDMGGSVSIDTAGMATVKFGSKSLVIDRTSYPGPQSKSFNDLDIVVLCRYPEIDSLGLEDTQVSDLGMKELGRLKRLKRLCLAGTRVGDEGVLTLSRYPALELLDLTNCPVTDAGLEHLLHAPCLLELILSGSRVSENGVEAFRKVRPQVNVIYVVPNP